MATGKVSRRRRRIRPPDRFHLAVVKKITALELTPLLDVGCNDCELGRRLPATIRWCGVDIEPQRSARARRRAVCADAVRLPFGDSAFGAVALLYMLGLVSSSGAALAEACRVLRPGGLVAAGLVDLVDMEDPPEAQAFLQRPAVNCAAKALPGLVRESFTDVEILTRTQHCEAGTWWVTTQDGPTPRMPFATTRREVLVFGRKP